MITFIKLKTYCALSLSINAQMNQEKKEVVAAILKKNTDGLTVIEISRLLNISRNTVAVALAELKGAELIRIRPIGKAKLNYWKGKNE